MNELKAVINGIKINVSSSEGDKQLAFYDGGRSLHVAICANEEGTVYLLSGADRSEEGYILPWPSEVVWVKDAYPETIRAKLEELVAKGEALEETMTDYLAAVPDPELYEGVYINRSPIKSEVFTEPSPVKWEDAKGRYLIIRGSGYGKTDHELSAEEYNEMTADLFMYDWLELDRRERNLTEEEQFEALKKEGYNVEWTSAGII